MLTLLYYISQIQNIIPPLGLKQSLSFIRELLKSRFFYVDVEY